MAQKPASSIQDWLESLDLGHFTPNFLVNGVTELHQVCHLTEDQLHILGITQRGYQKRILNHLPTQAEALLSEFVVNTEKDNHKPAMDAPMPPPRVNAKSQSKENGHNKGKKPIFDDESYLMHPPPGAGEAESNTPILPPRQRSAPNILETGKMDHQLPPKRLSDPNAYPSVPPRGHSPRMIPANPEVPPKQPRDVPRPQPRARPEPSTAERPPPLPDRRERQDTRPVPKQRPVPKAPAPAAEPHSLLTLSSPAEQFPLSEQNIYLDDFPTSASLLSPSVQFLSPPPILPLSQSQSHFDVHADDDSLPNLPPPPPPKSSPSPKIIKRDLPEAPPPARPDTSSLSSDVGSHLTDSSSVMLSGYEFDDNGPPSFPPPPPPPKAAALPSPSAVSTNDQELESLPVLPPPAPPRELSPSIGSCPPMPPKRHDTSNVSALTPLSSDLPAPPLPLEERPVQSVLKDLPQPHRSSFNPFESTNKEKQITFSDTLDIAQFDPLSTDENTIEFYPDAPPLRPPSLFCNPETFDPDLSFGPPPSTPPPQLPSEPRPSPVLAPIIDPDLSIDLMSRPVPLPPAARRGSHPPPTPPTRDLVSCMPHLPDRTLNRSLDSVDPDFKNSHFADKTAAPSQTEPYLLQEAVLNQEPRSSPPAESWQATALPAKASHRPLANLGPVPTPPVAPVRQNMHQSPVPMALPRKSSDLLDLEGYAVKLNTTGSGKEGSVDHGFRSDQAQSTFDPYSVAITQDNLEDQYSKIFRSSLTPKDVEPFDGSFEVPPPPSRPPPIPPRLDPQGEAEPSIASLPRPSPIGADCNEDDTYSCLADAESRPISGASSDRHSYILLSESISGVTEEHPTIPTERFMPTLASPFEEHQEAGAPLQQEHAKTSHKPVRRAPPPPVAKQAPSQTPKLPTRAVPVLPMRHSSPTLPPILNEDEYDLLDANGIGRESPPQGEPIGLADKFAFKELAQNEESGDDDDSGFDMDSLGYRKASVQEECDSVDLADRRSKIQDHVMRMGQKWQREPEVPDHPPVKRTHSRAIDEKTRHSLSKKLSHSLQDCNITAEVQSSTKAVQLKKSGYLWKQGGKQNNKGFRKRWVVFNGTEIRYFENEQSLSECKGIIPLGTMRDVKNHCGTAKFGDGKHNRIIVETTGRSFHFAAETLVEGTLWANTLMQAILSYKTPPGGFPVGGDMSCPDKMGYVKIDGYRTKRFLAIKGEMLCIYNTEMDFESAIAISDIQMKLASVKELPKNKMQLATPPKIYTLTVDSPTDVKEWIETMKEAIQEGLSDHSSLEKIRQNSSNKYCADCGMKDPDWASINLAIVVCKNCSGLHRNLGVQLSKVRSLKMDTKVWTPGLVQLMIELGNGKSNRFWEANLNEREKAVPDDTLERRQAYIFNKYKERKYCNQNSVDENMDRTLVKAASLGDLDECIRLVFSGAKVTYAREDGKTAYDVAMSSNFLGVAEFLQQNIGIQMMPSKNNGAPVSISKGQPKNDKASLVTTQPTRESKQEFIKKEGYLHKTGNNKKEFQRRYCTLMHGIFSYYDDRSQPPKNTIEGIDMVLIATAEQRPGHKYCFEIYTSVGRTYLLSAETEEDRREWMIVLAKIHSLECMWQTLEEFEQAGFLHKKEGAAATNWQRLWFILKGKSLVSYSVIHDKLEEIDLRKLISLSRQDSDSVGSSDYNHTLSIVLPGMNIYLRAETKQAADCWYEEINKVTMRKGQALEDQSLTRDNVPIIVSQCIGFVATHEGVMTEGIYRLSGTSSVIRKIVATFSEDPRTARLVEEYSVHDVTGALKKFFRELPDPLLTSKLYKQWTEVVLYKDHSARLQWHQHLLSELPPVNYSTLKMLIGHLKNVADNSEFNKMYVRNLAAVFGPTLMASSDSTFVHAEHEIAVIADLLTYYAWLFNVSDEEMAKEREKELKYQQGLEKIKAARASESFADEQLIMVEIFMGKREPANTNSINIKMSMDHTAEEIVRIALEQQKQIDDGSWAMFEVIAKGELQRLIHGYETVLPQILAWNQTMAADNYICIKHNSLIEKIKPYMDQATLTDHVKFSESKKSFKKYTFGLEHNMVTCYKEKSSTASYVWKVADMKIYTGVERKRSPPTQWGISFTINNEEGLKAMCLDSEGSYHFWLAGLLKSKVVDPSSVTYSPHALSFRSEHESFSSRQSRQLNTVVGKMSFWRKSRAPSVDDL
ncbi:uncharacterized protein [Asterias amurensis]|uniref:uncharacterized protein isoform X2 n=1 Tax=Asterias amurensis TaxID=7602 RepID=UPI003AB1B398